LLLVHTLAYLGAYPSTFGTVMSETGHGYWPLLIIASILLTAGAAIAARQRATFARAATSSRESRIKAFVEVWSVVLGASLAAFLLLENLEALVRQAAPPLLSPLRAMGIPAVAIAIVSGTALIAALVVVIATTRQRSYEGVLTDSYRGLVAQGLYSAAWNQAPWAKAFVATVLTDAIDARASGGSLDILECGCGTGVWLTVAAPLVHERGGSLAGFDLSPEMAAAARERLESSALPATIWVGDILDDAAYEPAGDLYDVVFAYDVVQQLPREIQVDAVGAMLRHVRAGGTLVIFDNDSKSRFGRVMGAKKWLRRYLNIPLVPKFYIHAAYPDLRAMRRTFERAGFSVELVPEELLRKRAMIVRVAA